ncbi:MAG: NYN domain-containing protein [Patescibacteria group bacterium]
MQTIAFIDGENFRKSIKLVFDNANKPKPIWHTYDFKGLLSKVLEGIPIQQVVFYFAKLEKHPETEEKSKQLIEERRLLKTSLEQKGYSVVIAGRVRGHMERVKGLLGNTKEVLTFKEKGVDVKIAVDMVSKACDGGLKQAIIGSSDSDLQPAIQELRKRKVICIYLGFENAPNKGLTATTNRTILIRNSEVLEFGKER